MSLNSSNISNQIKIIILDIFPAISELNSSGEEMFLIFQGLNHFYNLKELLVSHKIIEIPNNNQISIIISLIKNNNLMAVGCLNLKYGEQWITMTYENKKKSNMNLALSLIDCIKLKIVCDFKNKNTISTNNSNINNSSYFSPNNSTNLNTNKIKHNINQVNLKINKKNGNNKMILKGSPRKNNLDNITSKRSPKNKNINVNVSDYCGVKSSVKDLINNRMLKENKPNNNNINHQNIIRGSPRANYYTTLSKENIKKIDLNPLNKTRNSKKSPKNTLNYTSVEPINCCQIKKTKTSTNKFNFINKNKNSKLNPEIEFKEIYNTKTLERSPKVYHKNRLEEEIYKYGGNSGDKTFHYDKKKIKNYRVEKNDINNINNKINNNKEKGIKNNFSNNILNINYENNNNIINMNIVNNINNNNHCRTINNTEISNFNKTFGESFEDQYIKNKILNTSKPNPLTNNQRINYIIDNNKKIDFKSNLNSLEGEDIKNKLQEKAVIYTNKRMNIKKNKNQINKKFIESEKNLMNKIKDDLYDKDNNNEINNSNEINNNYNNIIINNENEKNENIVDEKNSEIYEDENNIFERIKEDFLLLYNDDYMNNIQDDLLKLEIELFIEKMTELIQSYHNEYALKKMEKKLYLNNYNLNSSEYKKSQKLIKKLEILKIDHEIKSKNINQSLNELKINKEEITLFENIFHDNNGFNNNMNKAEEKIMLKNIFNIIINKAQNKNIVNIDKLKKLNNL